MVFRYIEVHVNVSICKFNVYLCHHIILLQVVVGLREHCTVLYTVRGVRGLGIRMLTLDTQRLCTSRIEGSKYRWPCSTAKLGELSFVTNCIVDPTGR